MKDHLREQIIRMAMLAGFSVDEKSHKYQPLCIHHTHYMVDDLLTNFDALVRADEREACAKVCEELLSMVSTGDEHMDGVWDCINAIRARGDT